MRILHAIYLFSVILCVSLLTVTEGLAQTAVDSEFESALKAAAQRIQNGAGDDRAAIFEEFANKNSALAQYMHAQTLLSKASNPGNVEKALEWLKRSAEVNFAPAQLMLGRLYLAGKAVPRDEVQGLAWVRMAAAQGYVEAQKLMAEFYYNGAFGVSVDKAKSLELIIAAAEKGDKDSAFMLVQQYLEGDTAFVNETEAKKWMKKALFGNEPEHLEKMLDAQSEKSFREYITRTISSQDSTALFTIASLYLQGKMLPLDEKKAIQWMRKDNGITSDANAMFSIANLYRKGFHIMGMKLLEGSADLYLHWMQRAAESNYLPAAEQLEEDYREGWFGEQSDSLAFKWLLKAATLDPTLDHGKESYAYRVAESYLNGKGVAVNHAKAYEWYMKGADKNVAAFQSAIGEMYRDGKHVKKDGTLALQWLTRASAQDYGHARIVLAYMYYEGNGVRKDVAKANYWRIKACEVIFPCMGQLSKPFI